MADPIGTATDATKQVIVDGLEGSVTTAVNTAQAAMDTGDDPNPFLHAMKVAGTAAEGAANTAGKMAGTAVTGIKNVGVEALSAPPLTTPGTTGSVLKR
jgi:hypothetical protein